MIEDDLRAAMRAHEHEAPSARDFTPRSVHARPKLAPLVSAASVILIVLLSVAVWRHQTRTQRPAASTSCPGHYVRPDNDGRKNALLPDGTPREVKICAYLTPPNDFPSSSNPQDGAHLAVTGSRRVSGDLGAVTESLALLPPAGSKGCPLYSTPTDFDAYLIELSYPNGHVVWVSAPGDHCQGSSNGAFSSDTNLLPWVSTAYTTGHWPALRVPGRLGQEKQMVPGQPLTLHIAPEARTPTQQTLGIKVRSSFTKLISALNQAPTSTSNKCGVNTGATTNKAYYLTFSYAYGPDVRVSVTGGDCLPNVYNGNRRADNAATILPIVARMLAGG